MDVTSYKNFPHFLTQTIKSNFTKFDGHDNFTCKKSLEKNAHQLWPQGKKLLSNFPLSIVELLIVHTINLCYIKKISWQYVGHNFVYIVMTFTVSMIFLANFKDLRFIFNIYISSEVQSLIFNYIKGLNNCFVVLAHVLKHLILCQ